MVSCGNQFLSFLEMLLVLLPFLFLLFRLLGLCILRHLALGSGLFRLCLELRHVGDQSRGFLHRPGDGLQESGIQFLRNSLEGQRDNVVLGFVFQPV